MRECSAIMVAVRKRRQSFCDECMGWHGCTARGSRYMWTILLGVLIFGGVVSGMMVLDLRNGFFGRGLMIVVVSLKGKREYAGGMRRQYRSVTRVNKEVSMSNHRVEKKPRVLIDNSTRWLQHDTKRQHYHPQCVQIFIFQRSFGRICYQ